MLRKMGYLDVTPEKRSVGCKRMRKNDVTSSCRTCAGAAITRSGNLLLLSLQTGEAAVGEPAEEVGRELGERASREHHKCEDYLKRTGN